MLDRKYMINKRLELSKEDVIKYSLDIKHKLENLDCYKNAKIVGLYSPIKNEVELHLENKIFCYPKVVENDLIFYIPDHFEKGYFGIDEPVGNIVSKPNIDVIIVPLLYFDKDNNRMGYGKGFYDRYLKDYKGVSIGVAYDFQEVDTIETKATDVKLDYIIKGVL